MPLFFDRCPPDTESFFKELEGCAWVQPFYFDESVSWMGFTDVVKNWIATNTGHDTDYIVTTRLDSDDALNPDYFTALGRVIEIYLAEYGDGRLPVTFNFPLGLIKESENYQVALNEKNAFAALLEKKGDIKTCYAKGHKGADQYSHVENVLTYEPMWIVNIHGHNIGTRHINVGRRVPKDSWRDEKFLLPMKLANRQDIEDLFYGR